MESSCNSEETTTTVATLSRKDEKMTQKNSKRQKRMRNNVKKVLKESSSNCNTDNAGNNDEEEDDDKAEVEEKIMALQKIVPGGESLAVDMLFEETAGYILALQCQIKTLKVLASFVEASDKERMKLGG